MFFGDQQAMPWEQRPVVKKCDRNLILKHNIRLPLTPLDARYHEVVRAALREAGLLG